jgi:predicted hydrocarbon binding protein
MKPADLNLKEALTFDPQHGIAKLGGSRMVICGTEATGALFQELINVGDTIGAQVVMRRFGEASGHERARTVKKEFAPADKMDWLAFGPALHAWEGVGLPKLAQFEHDAPAKHYLLVVEFKDSYLAEQYTRVLGPASEPVCWQLAGYIAGYCSEVFDLDLHCREVSCTAKGDDHCEFVVKPRADWI